MRNLPEKIWDRYRVAWPFGIMKATRWLPRTPSVIEPEILGSGEPPSGSHDAERQSYSGIIALKFQVKIAAGDRGLCHSV